MANLGVIDQWSEWPDGMVRLANMGNGDIGQIGGGIDQRRWMKIIGTFFGVSGQMSMAITPCTQRGLIMKINHETANDTGRITFSFDDLPDVTFDAHQVHFDLCIHSMMFGFENRIKDTAAIPRKSVPGGTVTESMRRAKVAEMVDHLESGTDQWNLKSSGRRAPQNPTILKLAEKHACTYEEAEAILADAILADLV